MKTDRMIRIKAVLLGAMVMLASIAGAETYEADHTPWSGHWWPFHEGGLATGNDYRGTPSPLQKYELYRTGNKSGPSVTWYLSTYYDKDAETWWGHCGDWAKAAIYEQYDILPASIDNIIFRVGDKKGLLTIGHNNDLADWGSAGNPADFHYWLLHYIRDQKKAFIADLDSSDEIWNYPIFKYDMTSNVVGGTESVRVTIYYADDMVDPDYIGSQIQQETYTYVLDVSSDGTILDGTWTGTSVEHHPQQMFAPILPDPGTETLDYDLIRTIAETNDDFLENGDQLSELQPGTYHLILLDVDRYMIPCESDDSLKITVQKQDGSALDITAELKNAAGDLLTAETVTDEQEMTISLEGAGGPFFLDLSQTDYADPNIYTVIVDRFVQVSQNVPHVPISRSWSGFALTNPSAEPAENVSLVSYADSGDPIQTLLGPDTWQAGEKRVFLFDQLPWRKHELSDTDRLMILSDDPISVLNLIGSEQLETLASEVQADARGNHLVLPDTTALLSTSRTMSGKLLNDSNRDIDLVLRSYNKNGSLAKQIETVITARSTMVLAAGSAPFYSLPDGGWIDIQCDTESTVGAFQHLTSSKMGEGLFAIPAVSGKKVVPHIPDPASGWVTRLTLINVAEDDNYISLHLAKGAVNDENDQVVTLAPFEKTELTLQETYGKTLQDPLFRSVLEVSGTDTFIGYYTYEKEALGGEWASYPLIEVSDCNSEVVLQHCASTDGSWWTGIGIFNPGQNMTSVTVTPYDGDGSPIAEGTMQLSLQPGSYEVFLARTFFGQSTASKVSYIQFASDLGYPIGGFFLYGKETNQMLSGANM